jgi:hypothetical protein
MANSSSPSKRYAPRGLGMTRADIALTQAELDEANTLADEGAVSRAALLRTVYLLGLPLYRQAPAADAASA